ncbi:MAG: type II CRISPR RNA-guided endonuclease Cas9 [Minwuia sp.]|nr:type II CRISPR RNA-guided endonuclease Cas9 [Minwuia sp.]
MAGRTVLDRLEAACGRYPIDEELVLGLDVGIASIGSAMVRHGTEPAILHCGSRCFDAPENPKDRTLNNAVRREARLHRRTIRRRAGRMKQVRLLFVEYGLIATPDPDAFHHRRDAPDPWIARADGLKARLADDAFAAALLHIAKHRGFKSSSKSDAGENAPDENSKMLAAIAARQEIMQPYGSIARLMMEHEEFSKRKRNRSGEYSRTALRNELEDEVRTLFQAQRRLGNRLASEDLEAAFHEIAFFQLGLKGSEDLVGHCPFEPEEKRSPRMAPSFEKFRFVAKLNTVQVRTEAGLRRLTAEELGHALADWGMTTKKFTWNALAKKLGFRDGTVFTGIDPEKAKKDVAAGDGAMEGSRTLFQHIPTASIEALKARPEVLDRAAAVISFREDLEDIRAGLESIDGLEPHLIEALMTGVEAGKFARFTRTGHVSAKAARNILPNLLQGMVYSQACAAAGYDHTAERRIEITDIANPVVQRSLSEAIKQTVTLVHVFGARPGRIIVELARDVGKSAEEREKMTKGLEKRTRAKEKARETLQQELGLGNRPTDEQLRRYELWKEQNQRCLYSDEHISPSMLLKQGVEIDHALPRSRSQDNSFQNQVVCLTSANREKGNQTPFEWFGHDAARWEAFRVRVGALKQMKRYKRNLLLMQNFGERVDGFVARNLNDTRYASRALLAALRLLYADGGEPEPSDIGYTGMGDTRRRLFARPGAITAILRHAWGLGDVKDRRDDRHHGLDALICAAARSDWLLQGLTRQYQRLEEQDRSRWTPPVPAPWPGFRKDAIEAYGNIFVSRSERRRGRGAGHPATIRAIAQTADGERMVMERKSVDDLKAPDLKRIRDGEGRNRPLFDALQSWIDAGKPKDKPPLSPKGDPIRKVRLDAGSKSGFEVNGGQVDNGDMVRVDVFRMADKKGRERYFLVPIYRHQVMNRTAWPSPPNRAIARNVQESDWPIVGPDAHFCLSLYPNSYVRIVKSDDTEVEGYYRGVDRFDAKIGLSSHYSRTISRVGTPTSQLIEKFSVDRLGNLSPVKQEQRTWHGAVCT